MTCVVKRRSQNKIHPEFWMIDVYHGKKKREKKNLKGIRIFFSSFSDNEIGIRNYNAENVFKYDDHV